MQTSVDEVSQRCLQKVPSLKELLIQWGSHAILLRQEQQLLQSLHARAGWQACSRHES